MLQLLKLVEIAKYSYWLTKWRIEKAEDPKVIVSDSAKYV